MSGKDGICFVLFIIKYRHPISHILLTVFGLRISLTSMGLFLVREIIFCFRGSKG